MSIRLDKIEITNFKAFRSFELNFEGRHLLVYGDNGAGKSSLYWALYTFFQSARKTENEISKYFDSEHKERLLNIHEEKELAPKPGSIAFTTLDNLTGDKRTYRISNTSHDTFESQEIAKADMASDFVSYRFFFGFSDFKNSADFDIWPLFQKEILPYCSSFSQTSGGLEKTWNELNKETPNPLRLKGTAGRNAYDDFNEKLKKFSSSLAPVLETINKSAQKFYDEHFSSDSPNITFHLAITRHAYYSKKYKIIVSPTLKFILYNDGVEIMKPQSFMNEAKMTQLALSIRLGSSLVKLNYPDLKMLVLDDLLVSLDMSNRMKVVEILLSETFADYQKIILTHDLGFFEEFRRVIGNKHDNWCFSTLVGSADKQIKAQYKKSDLEIAQDYLSAGQIAECGNLLRKHMESNLTNFFEQVRRKKGLDPLIDREEFASLHHRLNEASNILSLGSYHDFAELLHAAFTPEQLHELVSPDEIDPAKFIAVTKQEKKAKGDLIAKLYTARPHLHQCIIELLSEATRKRLNALKLIEEVRQIKDRILNPASHAGTSPLFKKEAEDAIKIIKSLDTTLKQALETLQP